MKRTILFAIFITMCLAVMQAQNLSVSVAKFKGDKRAAVSLTFDDGLEEHYSIVAPELEKRGFRGTFGVCGASLNKDKNHIKKPDRMTWQQVAELSRRGHEISNHGWAHRNHGRFPLDTIRRDIELNDSMIQVYTGKRPMTFFYPNNTKRKEPMALAERGRFGTRTFQVSAGSKRTQEWFEHWLKELIDTCGWGVTMTHGITYGYDAFKDKQRFIRFVDLLKKNGKSLWVATFEDAMAYTKERDAVKLDVDRSKNKITVTPVLPLDKSIFNYPLTMVISGGSVKHIKVVQDGKKLKVTKLGRDRAMFDFNPSGGAVLIHNS